MKKIVFAVIAMLALGQYAKAQTVDSLDSVKEEKFASYYKLPSKSKPKISSSAYSFNYSEIAKTIRNKNYEEYMKVINENYQPEQVWKGFNIGPTEPTNKYYLPSDMTYIQPDFTLYKLKKD